MTALLLALLAQDSRRMLYTYLERECAPHFEARRKAVEALKTPADVKRRQDDLRAKFLAALGGLPERTPLNPRVTGVLPRKGTRIEKVIYESRPDHHVTANLYLPEGPGPFPGVLFPCGHYGNPKPAEEFQRACILLARTPITINQLTNVVPGVLAVYDLPDLAALVAPRHLAVRAPLDAAGKPVTLAVLKEVYAAAASATLEAP